MKILVTGASTDIGLKLTKRLTKNLDDLDELFLLSFTQSLSNEIDLDIHKKIKIINQNLLSSFKNELKEILKGIDILIHMAWIRPTNPSKSHDLNLKSVKNILNNLNKNAKIIFLSSVAGIPRSSSYYGKSKFQVSKLLYNSRKTSILICGLIVSDNKKSPYVFLKKLFETIPILIKFGHKIEILYTNSDVVINKIYEKTINFEKGVSKLYNNEKVFFDDFVKNNFNLTQKISINISLLIPFFLIIAKYLNYIPWICKITDKLITLLSNNKSKTDKMTVNDF